MFGNFKGILYNKTMKSYFDLRNQNCISRERQVLRELPDFATDYFVGIEQTTSPLTRLNYAYDLRLFFDYLVNMLDLFDGKSIKQLVVTDLNKIRANHIERFMSYLSSYFDEQNNQISNGEQSKARKLSSIKSFFKYFYNRDYINENVTSKVEMPKLHDKPIIKLETDEVVKLLENVEDGANLSEREKAYHKHTRLRDVAILTLMLGTGIRVSECVGLNYEDVDFEINGIKITRKGGNQEIVYFGDEVKLALINYMRERLGIVHPKIEPALFLSIQQKRMGVRAIQLLVKKYASLTTPLKKITPHKLRSTYGTSLYKETNDIYIVADVLGHKDVNTTRKHYAAVSDDLRRNVANKVKLRDN